MSGNAGSDKKIYFNITIFFLSLLFHILVILLFVQIKPLHKQTAQKKPPFFDLIELQSGKHDIIQPAQPPEHMQKKSTVPQTNAKQQTSDQIPKETISPNLISVDTISKKDTLRSDFSSNHITTEMPIANQLSAGAGDANQQANSLQTNSGHETGTIDAGIVGIKPVKISGVPPTYPRIAEDMGITGTVQALLTIDTTGAVKEVSILKSPHKSMSDEVIRTLLKWRFKPVEYKGKRVIIKKCIQEIEYKPEE